MSSEAATPGIPRGPNAAGISIFNRELKNIMIILYKLNKSIQLDNNF